MLSSIWNFWSPTSSSNRLGRIRRVLLVNRVRSFPVLHVNLVQPIAAALAAAVRYCRHTGDDSWMINRHGICLIVDVCAFADTKQGRLVKSSQSGFRSGRRATPL